MHVRDLPPLLLIAVIVIVFVIIVLVERVQSYIWTSLGLDDFPDLGFTLILLQLGHST